MAALIKCSFLVDHESHSDVQVVMAAADYHFLILGGVAEKCLKTSWLKTQW